MGPIPLNLADVIVLSVVIALVVLIVRGMLRGTIRPCDPAICSGSCESCGSQCASPRIHLTKEQLDELDALTRKAKEA